MNAFMHAIIDEKNFMKLSSGYQISKSRDDVRAQQSITQSSAITLILAERAGFRGNELQCFLGIEVIRDQDLAKLILICREVVSTN